MVISFRTNIDRYVNKLPDWDVLFTAGIPRKGDKIKIASPEMEYPNSLEVVDVIWNSGRYVICELWYSDTQAKMLQQAGRDL